MHTHARHVLTDGRDRMEDDRVRRRSKLNVKICVYLTLCVVITNTGVLAANCVSSQ